MRITFNKSEVAEVLTKHVQTFTKEPCDGRIAVVMSSLPDNLEVIVDTGERALMEPSSAKERFESIFNALREKDGEVSTDPQSAPEK